MKRTAIAAALALSIAAATVGAQDPNVLNI